MPSLQAAAEHLQSQDGCDGELPCLYGANSGAGCGDKAIGHAGGPSRSGIAPIASPGCGGRAIPRRCQPPSRSPPEARSHGSPEGVATRSGGPSDGSQNFFTGSTATACTGSRSAIFTSEATRGEVAGRSGSRGHASRPAHRFASCGVDP